MSKPRNGFIRDTTFGEWCYIALILSLVGCFLVSSVGCTQAQVDRAQTGVDQAKEILAKAEAAEARVAQAVAVAREIAEKVGGDQAKELVAKADAALAMARSGTEAAKVVVTAADEGLQAAKKAQAAGGSFLDILIAGLSVGIPLLGTTALAVRKAIANGQALRQTVAGVDTIRSAVGETDWKAKFAPALSAAQDESVKTLIRTIEAKG